MTKQLVFALSLCALALSGCAKKPQPSTIGGTAPGESIYGPVSDSGNVSPDNVPGSQTDLIAAVGTDWVLFELDSYTLGADAEAILSRQVEWLRQHPSVSFTIEGHCDERGTRDYNLALGDRRATAVANFLTAQGLPPSRIHTISYGKERHEALGSEEAAYAQNRRAVSIVLNPSGG
jgi:peptidoglycan-associated lipoprotein